MIKGFGESNWYILFDKKISILPEETIPEYMKPLPLTSFNEIMDEFKKSALDGANMGNLDDVISKRVLYCLLEGC